jgi:hypothetical protein
MEKSALLVTHFDLSGIAFLSVKNRLNRPVYFKFTAI